MQGIRYRAERKGCFVEGIQGSQDQQLASQRLLCQALPDNQDAEKDLNDSRILQLLEPRGLAQGARDSQAGRGANYYEAASSGPERPTKPESSAPQSQAIQYLAALSRGAEAQHAELCEETRVLETD